MYLIFSLDTEDFITRESDEAVKFWADIFSHKNIVGSFNMVTENARVLKRRGRKDILNLLKKQEINYHSNFHSIHPTFPEYLENKNWENGVEEVIKKEIKGLNDVKEIFEQEPIAFMQPGGSGTPQTTYAMKLLGMPVMEETTFLQNPSEVLPFWYCNSFSGLCWHFMFDSYYDIDEKERFSKMKNDFEKILEEREKIGSNFIILGTHPCKLVTKIFWDGINFAKGRNRPKPWKSAPLRSFEQVKSLKNNITEFINFILAKKTEVITYHQLYNFYQPLSLDWISKNELLSLSKKIQDEKLDWKQIGKRKFSLSEIFYIFVYALHFFYKEKKLPFYLPVWQVLGPTSTPCNLKKSFSITLDSFIKKSFDVFQDLEKNKTVPSKITIENGKNVGPSTFLKAMAKALLKIENKEKMFQIELTPENNYPTILGDIKFSLVYKNKWLFSPTFEGQNIIELAKLQTWTFKPAILK